MPYTQQDIDRYIESLNELEKTAYEIAKSDLGSSFDIVKSIGFFKVDKENKV